MTETYLNLLLRELVWLHHHLLLTLNHLDWLPYVRGRDLKLLTIHVLPLFVVSQNRLTIHVYHVGVLHHVFLHCCRIHHLLLMLFVLSQLIVFNVGTSWSRALGRRLVLAVIFVVVVLLVHLISVWGPLLQMFSVVLAHI